MKNKYKKDARLSEYRMKKLIKAFAHDFTALKASKFYNMNYRTVHLFYTQLRKRILEWTLEELRPFSGEIEVDESYFGARRKSAGQTRTWSFG